MKKSIVLLGVLLGLGSCLLWGMCGMGNKTSSSGGTGAPAMAGTGYWNSSCVTGDGKVLVAGGDHLSVIDADTGKVLEKHASQVKALGCEQTAGRVVAYDGEWRFPGKKEIKPAADPPGTAVGLTPQGQWISWDRTNAGRGWRGPTRIYGTMSGSEPKRLELVPAMFGKVGEGKQLPLPDSFAMRPSGLLDDGRLVVAAGWQPSQAGGVFEDVPWGVFAVNLGTALAVSITLPLRTDAAFNQSWMQKVAVTPDAQSLAVATHDGKQLHVASYAGGADSAGRVTHLDAPGGPNAIAIAPQGRWIAVGTEGRGKGSPAMALVIDEAGKVIWRAEFEKSVTGVHFLPDGSLIATSAGTNAVRVALPEGKELWRSP